ncbi:MAG: NeuD/PglB/VioB family sugar acetyltransferase [Planctomycetes bacterium]|nr:NeuD/PglB/VioB family sugar acetyltransferase [Planctomycetota bacterium]
MSTETQQPLGPLVIYGAGGHGRVVADAARAQGWRVVGFLDDLAPAGTAVGESNVLSATQVRDARAAVIVGIGDNKTRERIQLRLVSEGWRVITVIHPTAWISPSVAPGSGAFVGAGAIVQAGAAIGEGAIVNTRAVIEHHCVVGEFAHVAPGAALGGAATIGRGTLVGMQAAVLPIVRVGAGATVGAGAVVTKDVGAGITVVGVPARVR